MDYEKKQLKALSRISKKIMDAEGHITKIEDGVDEKKHRTAQHETIKDIKSILKHAIKVDKDQIEIVAHEGEGHKDSEQNHYVYFEDEEGVMQHLKEEFDELEKKLEDLKGAEGYEVKAFLAEKDYIKKAKEILEQANKYDPNDDEDK